ncbi:MAG TPA: DEAD/DEAH box helicase, partial [Woeseiaceae bacterium]
MTKPVEIQTVADFNNDDSIGKEFVDAWLSVFRRSPGAEGLLDVPLTELQRVIANDPDARSVGGPNLVIAGPTSAGKTFGAEMLMARLLTAARPPYGCIYAVPTRALATEKWERFKSVYGEEHVYVSSGDYQDQDAFILHRRFRIAVVVYEKLYGWLLQPNARNAILANLGLLLVDELQMLGDTQRGPRLELLLTFVRQFQAEGSKLRIVGLGPDREALRPVADWLNAKLAATDETQRPVPLAEGYICPHKPVHWVKLDPRLIESQVYVPEVHSTTRETMLVDLVSGLLRHEGSVGGVGKGRRLLIYYPTKDGAEHMARALEEALGRRQEIDVPIRQSFDALERTHAMERLRKTVLAGVGFHHGDLLFEERSIVERLFRADPSSTCVDVVVCTPTLAMGVNLPADYMLFPSSESYKPKDWDARTNLPTPLTPLEYRNFAGRAGRHRPNAPKGHHGVALFISDRTDEETRREIAEPIILGRVTPIASEMHRWPFGIETLALAAADSFSGLTKSVAFHEGVHNIFQSTYATRSGARLAEGGQSVPLADGVIPRVKTLAVRRVELITAEFAVPKTGNVVARAGIHILTYEALKGIAERAEKEDILSQPLVILEELALVPEIVKLYPTSLPDSAKEQMVVTRALRQFLRELHTAGHALGPRATTMIAQTHVPDRITLEGLMRVAAVWLFIEGRTAEQIGSQAMLPRIRYGACNLLGDQLHWLVSTLP